MKVGRNLEFDCQRFAAAEGRKSIFTDLVIYIRFQCDKTGLAPKLDGLVVRTGLKPGN